jgi:hypothetical protein
VTPIASNVVNLSSWVPVWESNQSVNSNNFVFADTSMAFYKSTSNLGSNQVMTPEQDYDEIYWKMSSVPLRGPISLKRTRGVIFTRL